MTNDAQHIPTAAPEEDFDLPQASEEESPDVRDFLQEDGPTAPSRRTVGPVLDQMEEDCRKRFPWFMSRPGSNIDRLEAIAEAIATADAPPPEQEEAEPYDDCQPRRRRAGMEGLRMKQETLNGLRAEQMRFMETRINSVDRHAGDAHVYLRDLASAVAVLLEQVSRDLDGPEAFALGARAAQVQKIAMGGNVVAMGPVNAFRWSDD